MRKGPLNPKYISGGQNRSYNQGSCQNRPDSRNRGQYINSRPRQNYRVGNFRGNTRGYSRQNNRGGYRNDRHSNYNRGRYRSRESTFTRNYSSGRGRSSVTVDCCVM